MSTLIRIFRWLAFATGLTAVDAQQPYPLRLNLYPERSSPQGSAFFGSRVAADGQYVAVGAPFAGSLYPARTSSVFVYHSGTGALVATLSPGQFYSSEGSPLAVSGQRVVVGVPDVSGIAEPGAVMIYDLGSATPSVPVVRLVDPNPAGHDKFGAAVAISGNRVVVGAPAKEGVFARGGAYVYDLGGVAPAVPLIALESPAGSQNEFGYSVAISGTRVVVGSNEGRALAYELTGASPNVPIALLADSSGGLLNNAVVAIAGNRVVVGTPGHRPDAPTGRVFVYDLGGTLPPAPQFLPPLLTIENPSPGDFDEFGRTVAISGNRVAVGAPGDNTDGTNDVGAAYLYDLESSTPLVPVAVLQNPMPALEDRFGGSVALTGPRLVIGAPWDDPLRENAGAAFLYDVSGPAPTTPRMLNNPTIARQDFFGDAVAISGDFVAVGARFDATGRNFSGSVRVYQLSNVTPTRPIVTLRDPVLGRSGELGRYLSISGTRLAVGAYNVAFVYDLASATPSVPLATFTHPEPETGTEVFGYSAAVLGDRVVVCSYGEHETYRRAKLHVYDLRSATPSVPVAILPSPSPNLRDAFGESVAISGDLVLVGAPANYDFAESGSGVVHIFDLGSATPATPARTLHNPRLGPGEFGFSVAVSGQRVVIGAPGDSGAAYIYDLASPTPTIPVLTLQKPAPVVADRFGQTVAITGSRVVIGAPYESQGFNGGAFVFDLDSATPSVPVATLQNPSPNSDDRFGTAVAISGNRVIVGAPGDDTLEYDEGAAYVFGESLPPPPADMDGDGLSDSDEINVHGTNPNLFDTDGDLVGDGTEVALASLGFNPLVDSSAQRTLLHNNARGIGLYRADDVQNLALGQPVLARDAANGRFQLRLGVERSANLTNWTSLTDFTATYDPATGGIVLDFAPNPTGAEFYRVFGKKP